jgi:hypothetical protein
MYTASIQGIRQNLDLFDHYARDLRNIEKARVEEDMVGMIIAETGVKANLVALRTASDMSRHLIDILA